MYLDGTLERMHLYEYDGYGDTWFFLRDVTRFTAICLE